MAGELTTQMEHLSPGGNVVFLSKAFGGWYEADGKLCLSLFREHVEESMKKDADGWQ